ncbi:MAG: bifunctional diguanylate cyclase/phosphodiesterase [Lachnospiraceae bacterium]|nr:bifunctional diguanylate cyclase/phosphodiesterase [Lachnospiraceae bacterium]
MDDLNYQIDLLNAMNRRLMDERKMLQLIIDTSSSAYIYVDFRDNSVRTLGSWSQFWDFELKSLSDFEKIFDTIEDDYIIPLRDTIYLEKKGLELSGVQAKRRTGAMWVECEANVIYGTDHKPETKVIRFRDVTKYNIQNEELTYLVFYDETSGLYNRNYFIRLLGNMLERADGQGETVAVMFINIDNFRNINDSLGIVAGDELVQQFGKYLKDFMSDNLLVSRFSGDLFCIAVYAPSGETSADHIYAKICEQMKKPISLSSGQEILLTISVGVAEYPEAATGALELVNCAEIVMFKNRVRGRNSMSYFTRGVLNEFLSNVEMENKLKDAIFSNNFMMYFQPQFRTDDGTLRGTEALIRWRDETGKFISPADFIPIAEQSGTIVPLGTWIIAESIRTYMSWKDIMREPIILSLNISAIQYRQPDFVENLLKVINEYNMPPESLELEITESVLIGDYQEIIKKLTLLRGYGIKISLDDFGTGYSSLSYLKNLPIDTLKIDKSFVDTILTDENTQVIMETVMYMAHKLMLETIAEGVETREQFAFMEAMDCTDIQGYYMAKPMPADEMAQVIKAGKSMIGVDEL